MEAKRKRATQKDLTKIVTRVIQFTKDYTAKDIAKWRRALRAAENKEFPNRSLLYDLYDDLAIDNHFVYLRSRTHMDVIGVPYQIVDDSGNVNDELTALFRKQWFRTMAKHAIDAQFFGFSVLELTEADAATGKLNFELIPRKHIVPEVGAWKVYQHDTTLHPYRSDPKAMRYLIEVGEPDDLGLLNKLAPTILFKKIMMLLWAEFGERFGMPLAKAKTNTRDTKAVANLQNFLKDMASKSYAIIDNTEELEFVESVKSDAFNVFDKMIERCNSEMSKAVRLQTLSADAGERGARSLGEVHFLSDNDVSEYNRDYLSDLVNETLLPLLAVHGFKTEGHYFRYIVQKQVSQDQFEQDKWLDEHFEIDTAFWAEKYNTPIKARKAPKQHQEPTDKSPENKDPEELRGVPESILKLHADLRELYTTKHEGCGHG
jgi:phage gp29-like protein